MTMPSSIANYLRIKLGVALLLTIALAALPDALHSQSTLVPHLVNFSGTASDLNNKPMTRVVGITFALYKEQQGGAPLWLETQNAQADRSGHYSVQLGATRPDGIPADLFVSGEAHWLGIQISGQPEQPRVFLLSVPYALKAADAETIGGLPPSAFVRAPANLNASEASPGGAIPNAGTNVPASTGSTNFIPIWTDGTGDLGNSVLFQSGSGSTAKVGINTATPSSTLDVKGSESVRGMLTLQTTGTATATAGKNSQPQDFLASSFSSSTGAAVNQRFQWQAEPSANNTATPSGTLNLLYGLGSVAASETGLKINPAGLITFAPGQIFPGTGSGTITGVTAGSGLSGGGTSGKVSVSLLTSCSSGQSLEWTGTAWACASGLNTVTHDTTLTGSGNSGSPLGLKLPMSLSAAAGSATITAINTGSGAGVLGQVGNSFPAVQGNNTGTGNGVQGSTAGASGLITIPAAGVRGDSNTLSGVIGTSGTAAGVLGSSLVGAGVTGTSGAAQGVLGSVTTKFPAVQGINTGSGHGVQGTTGGSSGIITTAAGVEGDSATLPGVIGASKSNIGVLGTSANSSGTEGITSGTAINTAGVYGLAGTSSGFTGIAGVWGDSNSHVGAFGSSANQAGVLGQSTNGAGVFGTSKNGFGMATDGNVQQARGGGGWVKAMAYIDPYVPGGIAITRCYNSQATGSAISTPPCGISINHAGQGINILDFGFQVSDRFYSATVAAKFILTSLTVCGQNDLNCDPVAPTQVIVYNSLTNCTTEFCALGGSDVPFVIFIY